ncbi:hypothetical protein [Variovorax rhizosphaerae]|uniref:Uncharacterized protein n=1 Tax=Variovorax rhizosphaerae TaxID=1836200 RepID=A0ABU8X0D4_9BURK
MRIHDQAPFFGGGDAACWKRRKCSFGARNFQGVSKAETKALRSAAAARLFPHCVGGWGRKAAQISLALPFLQNARSNQGGLAIGKDRIMSDGIGKQLPQPGDLADVLDANKEATEEVKQVADHLAVVHAVLEQAVPAGLADDVALATQQTEQLGKQLEEASDKLDKVNEQLATEVNARKSTEGGA